MRDDVPGTLYRAYDKDGQLLYIGATVAIWQRITNHKADKHWWNDVTTIALEHFPTRELALNAEGAAIVAECPRYNVFGGVPPALIDHEPYLARRRQNRREFEERRAKAAHEQWLATTYPANGSVRCTSCGRYPERMPKGTPLEELVCKECRHPTLVRVEIATQEKAA